ncbi:MAG TPA: MqnA/MqnD/SBP family protein, partial [Bacteroidota bacterium]
MIEKAITVGHSPDPDDAFMFYGLASGKVKLEGIKIEHLLEDIQSLNERAMKGELAVTAIS